MKDIIEKFSWLTPEFTVAAAGKTVKIKGLAIPHETVSRNNKKYVDKELALAARTWVDAPITENHKAWNIKGNQLGKVNWMEYENGAMEYVAEVWNPEMAAELKLYAKDPASSKIRGVSVEADFLHIACAKCGKRFLGESEWRTHMMKEEFVKDLPLEPHGIRGRALSIVTAPESPGVQGTTLEVMETVQRGLLQLLETVINKGLEIEKMTKNDVNLNVGPPYTVNMQVVPRGEVTETKPIETPAPVIAEAKAPDVPKPVLIEKLNVKEESGKFDFDACMKEYGDEEKCAMMAKKEREAREKWQATTAKLNELVEWANNLKSPEDDKTWEAKIQAVTETLQTKTTAIASDLVTLANSIKTEIYGKLNETVEALPKDDLGWKEIKPYDDAELKTSLETMNKTLLEKVDQTTQKVSLIESENLKVKETFEKLLDKADKNIVEVQKTLEQRENELKETVAKLEAQEKELAETKNKLQETTTLAENTSDKLKPQFKASAKQTVAKLASSTFNPYDPTRK